VRDTVFASGNVPRVDRVDFSVNVGTAVPSHVHVVAVPDTLVQIYPQWRGNEYFVVRDEIVIVDHSRKIVAVIPGGSSHASKSSSTTGVDLSPAEIRQVQTVLIEKGYLHGRADGEWGSRTREALITFQKKEGIEASGRIDSRTVSSLGLSGKIQATGGANASSGATSGTSASQGASNSQPSSASSGSNNNAASTSSPSSPSSTTGQSPSSSQSSGSNPSGSTSASPSSSSTPSNSSSTKGSSGSNSSMPSSSSTQSPDQQNKTK